MAKTADETKKKDVKLALEELWAKEEKTKAEPDSGANAELGKVEASYEELKTSAAQADEMRELAMRIKAEFDNFRRRTQSEKSLWTYQALESILGDMLGVLDDFDRALEAARQVDEVSPVVEGIEMIARRLLGVLTSHGVERVECNGQTFDPEIHEAVMREPSADAEPGTILEELQPGYKFKDRILRHPKVKVAVAPEE